MTACMQICIKNKPHGLVIYEFVPSEFDYAHILMYTRYFQVAGITIRFVSELPIEDSTFAPKFKLFEVDGPGKDNVHLVHRFFLPEPKDYGKQVYSKSPWVIYKNDHQWTYVLEISSNPADKEIRQISFANPSHTEIEIFNGALIKESYVHGYCDALTMAPTDQILLARLLAERSGCYIHSDGINMDGNGFLFVGHSGAGKSTIATMLKDKAEILCDDRMIVRKWQNGYRIHGNWSHGTLPIVSAHSAPLKAVFFLEQAEENCIMAMEKKMDSISILLGCIIKPMVTREWWESMLFLIEDLVNTIPCYRLRFDKSGDIYEKLKDVS